jgi:hypothetical protein
MNIDVEWTPRDDMDIFDKKKFLTPTENEPFTVQPIV